MSPIDPELCRHVACDRDAVARGLCFAHYQRLKRGYKAKGAIGPYVRRKPIKVKPLTTDELIAEIEYLAGTDWPTNIAARLGFLNSESLARRLQRVGRHDLAHLFERRAA